MSVDQSLRILVSNDDGINAPGIAALATELRKYFQVTVVAPSDEKSTTGHSLSLDHPLRLHPFAGAPDSYHCNGYPADTVLMALGHVMKDRRPQVVVSGINRGANLGQDLYYSGTMAAAREGAFHQLPAIAVSLVIKQSGDPQYFETAAIFVAKLLQTGIHLQLPPMTMLNINVPNVPLNQIKGVKCTRMGFREYSERIDLRRDSRDRSYYWIAGHLEGHRSFGGTSDCEATEAGHISVTPLELLQGEQSDFGAIKAILATLSEFPRC